MTGHPRDRYIDTAAAAAQLRSRIVDVERRRILISRIADSDQARDLTLPPNCRGLGRIRHFRLQTSPGWPPNPLPIDPAHHALNLVGDGIRAQAFQNAACAWRCWYCYVPFAMLRGNAKRGEWITAEELVDLFLQEPDRPSVIDLTGGSPDLTPEWVIWMMRALRARGLETSVYLWSDDNLSTDYFWRYLSEADRAEIAAYPLYGRVGCFKGFDAQSFAFNTTASPDLFDAQFDLMARLIRERIDCYCYATFTSAGGSNVEMGVRTFVDRLQRIHPNLPLRTVPLRIEQFYPTTQRLNDKRQQALGAQEAAAACWLGELERRFTSTERAVPIHAVPIRR